MAVALAKVLRPGSYLYPIRGYALPIGFMKHAVRPWGRSAIFNPCGAAAKSKNRRLRAPFDHARGSIIAVQSSLTDCEDCGIGAFAGRRCAWGGYGLRFGLLPGIAGSVMQFEIHRGAMLTIQLRR